MTEPTAPPPGEPGVEETPPATGTEEGVAPAAAEPTAPTEAPTEAPAAEPEAAAPPPTETPGAPSQELERELSWYRSNYDAILQRQEGLQRQLDEYETAAMSEDERAVWELQREREQLQGQQQEMAEAAYAADLYYYYGQFVPREVIQGQTPTDWQNSVLTHMQAQTQQLQAENQRLTAENTRLKQAAVPGQGAPQVTGTQGAATGKKPLGEYTWQELEDMKEAAIDGTLREYPAALPEE
jgi:hypothetical protein